MDICVLLAKALTTLTYKSVDICIQDPKFEAYAVVGRVNNGRVREVEGRSGIDLYLRSEVV